MNLIDTLRKAVDDIPPSHQPANVTDAIGLVGSLIAFAEHGAEKFVNAVEHGNVADLYKDAETLEAEAAAPKNLEDANAQIAALEAQLAAARGVANQTTVGPVEPVAPEAPAPEAPAPVSDFGGSAV
jgi:hypothetical protein